MSRKIKQTSPRQVNQIDIFDLCTELDGEEPEFDSDVIDIVEIVEERKIPYGLSCPECGRSMKLQNIDKKDKNSGKAWYCTSYCGRQTYDEFGRR